MVHSTDIVEFELRSKKFSLAVRKKEALVQPEPMYLPVQAMLSILARFTWVGICMTNVQSPCISWSFTCLFLTVDVCCNHGV